MKIKEINGLRQRYTFVNHTYKDGIEESFLKLWSWIRLSKERL